VSMNDPQEQMRVARNAVAQRTGGRYRWTATGGWRTAREEVGPTGSLRRAGSFIRTQERESLEQQAQALADEMAADWAAPETQGGQGGAFSSGGDPGDTLTSRQASDILQIAPQQVAHHAREGNVRANRAEGRWQFQRSDVDAFRTQRDAERASGEGGEGDTGSGAGASGSRGRGRGNDIAGMFASGGALVGAGVAATTRTAQSIAGFATRTIASALEMAAGASGTGLARMGDAVAGLFTGALRTGGQVLTSMGQAVSQLLTGALSMAGALGAGLIGGAILGLFIGAIATIGTGLASAISETVGAVAEAAEKALSGVVTVLQDLTRTGREASSATFAMRAIGGMQPGTDLSTMLFGKAINADTGSMFSSWQGRPEFQQAKFGAFGMDYDPEDPVGSMQGAAGMLRGAPGMLQHPMASVLSGGHPDALMRMANMSEEQVEQSADLAREFGKNTRLMERIFGTLEPTLNRLSTLFTGLKLEVLGAAIPVIESATSGLFNLWDDNKATVFTAIEQIPEMLGKALDWFFDKLPIAIDWLEKIYTWFAETLWPKLSAFFSGVAGLLGISMPGAGGSGGGAGGGFGGGQSPRSSSGTGGAPGIGGGGFDFDTSNIADRAKDAVADRPWLQVLGGGIVAKLAYEAYKVVRPVLAGGSRLAQAFGSVGNKVLAAIPATSKLGAAASKLGMWGMQAEGSALGGIAGKALPIVGDALSGWMTGGVKGDREAGRIGGTAISAGLGALQGGLPGMVVRTLANEGGQFARLAYDMWQSGREANKTATMAASRGYVLRQDVAKEMGFSDKAFQSGLSDEDSSRVEQEYQRRSKARKEGIDNDPVRNAFDKARDVVEEVGKRSFYDEWKRAMADALKEADDQKAARGVPEAKVTINPSAEFAARMEYLQAQDMFRSLQVSIG